MYTKRKGIKSKKHRHSAHHPIPRMLPIALTMG